MKFAAAAMIAILGAPSLCAAQPSARTRVILVGDSTMARGSGWGDAFCAAAAPDVACLNMAKGGRSSKSYRAEGSWAEVQKELARPGPWKTTWVLVQFGHNDQPGKSERSSDFATEFSPNMAGYVADIRAAKARPILVTPLTRRQFRDGQLIDGLSAWSAAVRKVAAHTKTPLLDLGSDSVFAVQAMGPVKAMDFAQAPPPPEVVAGAAGGTTIEAPKPAPGSNVRVYFDYTHLGPKGAAFFAAMVQDELKTAVPALAARFRP